ncbi:hypothetical protein AHF37_09866 [Paragonimus kellicotti]|nr:hypothetical protein AHF37_09866 [Paragonimus kellicotti]
MPWGFNTCGPNEAMVVSGCCYRRPLLIPGGRVFVWPVIQQIDRIPLNTMTLLIESPRIYTQLGVPITVTGVAQGYLNSLGLARTAQVKCDARIGEAEARRDAGIREAEAEKQRVAGRLLNDIEIAKAKRDFELKNASYQKEVQARKAVSELAYELQVKVNGSNHEMLAAACEQFLGKTDTEIRDIAQETLEGHQRAIMGNMTVEEIYKDRKKFSKAVFEVASSDLVNMGISVVSYTLKDIKDDEL